MGVGKGCKIVLQSAVSEVECHQATTHSEQQQEEDGDHHCCLVPWVTLTAGGIAGPWTDGKEHLQHEWKIKFITYSIFTVQTLFQFNWIFEQYMLQYLLSAGRRVVEQVPHTTDRWAGSGPAQRKCSCVPPADCWCGSRSPLCFPGRTSGWSHCHAHVLHTPVNGISGG